MAKKYKNLGFGVLENLGNGQNDLGKPGISTLWGRGHPEIIGLQKQQNCEGNFDIFTGRSALSSKC